MSEILQINKLFKKPMLPAASSNNPVFWTEMATPLGTLLIGANNNNLSAIRFAWLEATRDCRFETKALARNTNNLLTYACSQLSEYFSGQRHQFELPLDLSILTAFQRQVLAVTGRIPWGEVWSYQRVGAEMGRPNASRPVGQALGRNPIPIVIPCHRVIASDGGLGGYCGKSGLDLKRWLLRHEGVQL